MAKIALPTNLEEKTVVEAIALLSGVFRGPDLPACRAMRNPAWLRPIRVIAAQMGGDTVGTVANIGTSIADQPDAAALFELLENEYVRLFINTRGALSAPLYQSCYENDHRPDGSGLLMGKAATAMGARLQRAGLALSGQAGLLPDHLAVELEYLYFLMNPQAGGRRNPAPEIASEFAAQVMLPWVRRFGRRLASATETVFYPAMASLTIALLDLVARTPAACAHCPEGSG
jgi:TorA maturation chaperone TorD